MDARSPLRAVDAGHDRAPLLPRLRRRQANQRNYERQAEEENALHLAEREQFRLPFGMESSWLGPALRRDPELAGAYRRLFAPARDREQR